MTVKTLASIVNTLANVVTVGKNSTMMRSKCVADLNELGGGVMCLLQYSMALERILELMVLLTKIYKN